MPDKNTYSCNDCDRLFDKRNDVALKLLKCSSTETASLFGMYLRLDSKLNAYIFEKKYQEGYDSGFYNGKTQKE